MKSSRSGDGWRRRVVLALAGATGLFAGPTGCNPLEDAEPGELGPRGVAAEAPMARLQAPPRPESNLAASEAEGDAAAAASRSRPLPAGTDIGEALNVGADLIEAGRYEEALAYLARARASFPEEPNLVRNMVLASERLQRPALRLQHCLEFRRLVPTDPQALEMLIAAYQASGDLAARDQTISELYALRGSSRDPALRQRSRFLRDQFDVAGQTVLAFQFFEPQGRANQYYRFAVFDEREELTLSFALQSPDWATRSLREAGRLAAVSRLYVVERHQGWRRSTLKTYASAPGYDEVRRVVIASLRSAPEPISTDRYGGI